MNDKIAVLSLLSLLTAPAGFAAAEAGGAAVTDCAAAGDIKSKSRQLFEGKTLMINLLALEAQGEADFRPKYPAPASQCVRERFDVGGIAVTAIESPFERGEQTLHYRFAATNADETREILVLYDGLTSFMAKKDAIFMVVENRKGNISYYAMFREQPAYAALKLLATGIVDGSTLPLATVNWPAGAKEPEISAYDGKRLK